MQRRHAGESGKFSEGIAKPAAWVGCNGGDPMGIPRSTSTIMKTTGAIVAAVDFSEESAALVSHAVSTAEQGNLPLVLIHVIDSGILRHHSVAVGRSPGTSELVSEAQSRLDSLLSATGGHARVEVTVGRPVEEIHAIVQRSDASLLIIGSNDLTKKHVGPVTSNSLRTIPCDVLILRDWQGIGFKRILVCTDFGATSGRALQRGVALARLHGSKLDVAYVMYPSSQNVWGEVIDQGAEDAETYAQHCRKNVEAEMDAFVAKYGAGIGSVDHRISILKSASPSLALKCHVGDTGADLAILGSRIHSRIASLFSATNAEQLLQYSTVSVLAVRDSQ